MNNVEIKSFWDTALAVLTVYREASGESLDAKRAVAWVLRNRVEHPSWYGRDWNEVITKRCQFTSMVPPKGVLDPNLLRYGSPEEQALRDTVQAVTDVMAGTVVDPTGGATFYFDKSLDNNPPPWAKVYIKTVDIGNIHFYKVK